MRPYPRFLAFWKTSDWMVSSSTGLLCWPAEQVRTTSSTCTSHGQPSAELSAKFGQRRPFDLHVSAGPVWCYGSTVRQQCLPVSAMQCHAVVQWRLMGSRRVDAAGGRAIVVSRGEIHNTDSTNSRGSLLHSPFTAALHCIRNSLSVTPASYST